MHCHQNAEVVHKCTHIAHPMQTMGSDQVHQGLQVDGVVCVLKWDGRLQHLYCCINACAHCPPLLQLSALVESEADLWWASQRDEEQWHLEVVECLGTWFQAA